MMSIAFKEGVKVPPPALNEIILASNQDIRQVCTNVSYSGIQVKQDTNCNGIYFSFLFFI